MERYFLGRVVDHLGCYAVFLLDPDGNNIEAKVDERVSARSAEVITVETPD